MPFEAQSAERFLPAVAIETSRRPGSVALVSPSGELSLRRLAAGADQAGGLFPALDGLIREAGLEPGRLHLVVLGTGPGSFTGLRAGAAVAAVLARFLPAPLVALPSLEGSPLLLRQSTVALCLDALRGQVHGALYHEGSELLPPTLLHPREFAERLRAHQGSGLIGGEGLELLEEWGGIPQGWARAEGEWEPRADQLALRGLERAVLGSFTAAEGVEPLYLRPAAAEEVRSARRPRS